MDTGSKLIETAADEFKTNSGLFLTKHARLERDHDLNNARSGIFILSVSGEHRWLPLDAAGSQLQAQLRRDFEHLTAILKILIKGQPASDRTEFEQCAASIQAVIDQENHTWSKTVAEANQKLGDELGKMIRHVAKLYDGSESNCIFVPDTNALLHNPDLEAWTFDGVARFTLLFTPAVLSELDQLKVNHRVDTVRQKSEGLIRRIKGYRTRGRLTEGVPLKSGRSILSTLAIEPDMEQTLPWLNPANADDRILATLVEIMRQHPRCVVALVTRDINLQNKAEFARLLYLEPPDPVVAPP